MPLEQHASVGHWQAQVVVTHPLWSFAGSTPARRTDNTARSSNGRMRDPHSRDMGSIRAPTRSVGRRVTDRLKQQSQVAEPVYARRSERRVRFGHASLTLALAT